MRPGDSIFVILRPRSELLRAACSWAGESYPFLPLEPQGAAYRVVLPVALETRAGEARATVYWKYADGRMGRETLAVEVAERTFGVQRLRLSAQQQRTYTTPEARRERELIGAALARTTETPLWQGSFLMPVEGRISTEFGLQRYINDRLASRHRGLDIAAPEGTPVLAAADGVVSLADDSFILHGQTIVLDHGHGVSTLYLHLSGIAVRPGEHVAQGQVIGRVGATGVATGPHLHYSVYVHRVPVDPHFWSALAP